MSTHSRLVKLIARGPKVRCTRTGQYCYYDETSPDGNGGRILTRFDYLIHDQTEEVTKYRKGKNFFTVN